MLFVRRLRLHCVKQVYLIFVVVVVNAVVVVCVVSRFLLSFCLVCTLPFAASGRTCIQTDTVAANNCHCHCHSHSHSDCLLTAATTNIAELCWHVAMFWMSSRVSQGSLNLIAVISSFFVVVVVVSAFYLLVQQHQL